MESVLPPVFVKELAVADAAAWGAMVVPIEGYSKEAYMAQAFAEQAGGKRIIFGAFQGAELVGYVFLNFHPQYQNFRSAKIPELQDLYVVESKRNQGIGALLVAACEEKAKSVGSSMIGLGVSVQGKSGAAQRLYAKLGYVPDGNGLVYEREQVAYGQLKPVDDALCLMMIKEL